MARHMATVAAGAAAADAIAVMDRIGKPTQESVLYARSLLSDLPASIREAMIAACRSAGVPLWVAYYRRALPRFLAIRELLGDS